MEAWGTGGRPGRRARANVGAQTARGVGGGALTCASSSLPVRDIHGEGLLAAAEGANVRRIPVKADQAQEACDEPASP